MFDRMSPTRYGYVLNRNTMSDNIKYWLTTCAFTGMVSDVSKNGSLIWLEEGCGCVCICTDVDNYAENIICVLHKQKYACVVISESWLSHLHE